MTANEIERKHNSLSRRNILLGSTTLAAASAVGASAPIQVTQAQAQPVPSGRKPNILVIMGDDIDWFNPSIYHRGDMGYWTPNIALAPKARCSRPGTPSKAAPPAAPPSSPGNRRSAPA
jgi:hypothetical protein